MEKFINTVPAENQMVNSDEVSFLGCPDTDLKILIVGNSITRHGPSADIGWNYDWGMAASASENDYVHRLYEMLTASGRKAYIRVRQAAYWERHFVEADCLDKFAEDKAFQADLIIFRLGENVEEKDVPYFKDATIKFVNFLSKENTRFIFTTSFWRHELRDQAITEVAAQLEQPLATITCTDEALMARGKFENPGVAGHPGDTGMEMIARKIFELI